MVFLLQYEPRVVRARRETRGPRATASGSVAENMAESAATPIDLDDTLPEGVYGANISDQMLGRLERGTSSKVFWHPYLQKIVNAGGIKAYAKAHRQQLATMFVRTRCFQPVPDEIVPLIVDYGFHVGFY